MVGRDIALVLSSGGARGYAHVGAIKALLGQGNRITSIAGTSIGSLVGGMYASGELESFERWVRSLDKLEVLKLTDFQLSTKGLVKGNKIIRKLKEIVPPRRIEELDIPYVAVATDIMQGIEVVFDKGDLYEAIRASIAIPTIFKPLKKGKRYLVDGGLLNPIPTDHVSRKEGDLLVVVDVNAPLPPRRKEVSSQVNPEALHQEWIERIKAKLEELMPAKKEEDLGMFNLFNRSIQTMMQRIGQLTMEKDQPDLLISVSRQAFGAFEFYHAAEIIEEGEHATLEALAEWRESMASRGLPDGIIS